MVARPGTRGVIHTAGMTGGIGLDLSGCAHLSYPQSQVRIIKVCELCGRNFLTLTMAPLRDCPGCMRKEEARVAALSAPLPPEERDESLAEARHRAVIARTCRTDGRPFSAYYAKHRLRKMEEQARYRAERVLGQ